MKKTTLLLTGLILIAAILAVIVLAVKYVNNRKTDNENPGPVKAESLVLCQKRKFGDQLAESLKAANSQESFSPQLTYYEARVLVSGDETYCNKINGENLKKDCLFNFYFYSALINSNEADCEKLAPANESFRDFCLGFLRKDDKLCTYPDQLIQAQCKAVASDNIGPCSGLPDEGDRKDCEAKYYLVKAVKEKKQSFCDSINSNQSLRLDYKILLCNSAFFSKADMEKQLDSYYKSVICPYEYMGENGDMDCNLIPWRDFQYKAQYDACLKSP